MIFNLFIIQCQIYDTAFLHFDVLTEIHRKVAYTGNITPAYLSHVCILYKRIPIEIYSSPPLYQHSHHGTNCCTSRIPHKIFKKNHYLYNFHKNILQFNYY